MKTDIDREKMSCVFTTLTVSIIPEATTLLKLRGQKLKGKELTLSHKKIIKYETSCSMI